MNESWRRRLHRCSRACGWTVGVTVIVLAVMAALAQLLLPLLARHPDWVATQMSARLQRPVSFTSMEGRWTLSGPEFTLRNVRIGAAQGEAGAVLELPESELKLDFGGWLLPSRHLLNLHVRDLQLNLLRDATGWHVNGIGVAGGREGEMPSFGRVSMDLWLEDLRVVVTDSVLDRHYALQSKRLRLSHQGNQLRFGGVLRREGVDAAVRTVGRFSDDGRAGKMWVHVDGADLKPLLEGVELGGFAIDHGRGQLSAWLDWDHGALSRSLVSLDLAALAVTSPDGSATHVATLRGLAGVRRLGQGYDVRWAGSDGGALALELHEPGTERAAIDLVASKLQLAPLLPWLALKPQLSPAIAGWLSAGNPRGEIGRLVLHWTQAGGLASVDLAFDGLGIDAVDKLPGVSHLHGELRGDAEALSLELPAQATTLALPHSFRQPFVLSKLAATMAFWSEDGDWHIGADALDFAGAGYAGQVRGELVLPARGGAPFIDMVAAVEHAEVVAAKLFWPVDVMPASTVDWLDRGLQGGQVDDARVVLRGDMRDWPFPHHEGRFEARAVISDLTLDYGKDWPIAEGVSAVAMFINNGMLVEAEGGRSLGVNAERAVALIPDFHEPLLDLNVRGSGSGASLMEFVRKSPVGKDQAGTLAKLKLGGAGAFNFHLTLPPGDTGDEPRLDGQVQLENADLSAPEWNLKLDKLAGPLRFDLHGLDAGRLDASFRGQPSTLTLSIGRANADPATVLAARLRGNYRLDELVQDYPALTWLGQIGEGRSAFEIGFRITRVPGSDAVTQVLSADSSLQGIALALPAPLDKSSSASMPLHLSMSLPVRGGEVRFALGHAMRGYLRLPEDDQHPLAATLALGEQMPETLPPRDLRIRGHAARFDVTGWVQRAVAGSSGEGPGLESLNISTDQAEWFGRTLGPLKLDATLEPGVLSVNVDGPAMLGNYSVPTQELNKRGVTVRLKRLYWPSGATVEAAREPANAPAASPAPAAAGSVAVAQATSVQGPAAAGSTPAAAIVVVVAPDPANTGINPAALPPFHVWVGDLRMGEAKLGEARLETWPTPDGLHIEQLRALSSRVQINASGDWNGDANHSRTHMRINFAAEDLGAMMGALGYDGLVGGGRTRNQLDASWPGAPSGISLVTMDGTLSIQVNDGRIPEAASPGVGRLLGLVSLAELPRRLTLDFGDVFGKGLAFDSITGDFRLADGNATTENLVIAGPSANIRVTGRTGLRARDYDQQMLVVPHVGNSLPLVGAVVGGPIGAAAGFAVQGLVGKGLNQAASARYRVTGSWDDPVMTLLEKQGALVAPPAPLLNPPVTPPAAGSVTAPVSAPDQPAAPHSLTPPAAAGSVQPSPGSAL